MEFQPVVYEHAAACIDKSPWEVSRDPDLLFHAHSEAFEKYHHNPIVVGIDIYNLEVEAYGATVGQPTDNTVPSLATHPCDSITQAHGLPLLDPASDGRIPMIIQTAQRLAAKYPDSDLKVPVSGPFSIAANLVGLNELLCDILQSPDQVRDALLHLVDGQVEFCRAVASAGIGISFFESAASPPILSPALFERSVYPALAEIMKKASPLVQGQLGCVVGGDTELIIESIIEAGASYVICPGETNQQMFMHRMQSYPDVEVRVNMNPGVFIGSDAEAAKKEAGRVYSIASQRPNTSVGTGVLPFETNSDLVIAVRDYLKSLCLESER